MQASQTPRSRFRIPVPRFSLRGLMIGAAVIAVLVEVGHLAWPRLLRYREGRQYASLQSTKQWQMSTGSFAIDDGRGIPDGFVILVRRGNTFGCFIPRNQNKKGESVEYDWYFRTDGRGRFDPEDPQVNSGHSFAGPYVPGIGHSVVIEFGPFSIPWSGHAPGWGYVYYDYNPDPPDRTAPDVLRISSTDIKSLDLINARDRRWIYKSHRTDVGLRGNEDATPMNNGSQRDH
jgi:hypothetical protein